MATLAQALGVDEAILSAQAGHASVVPAIPAAGTAFDRPLPLHPLTLPIWFEPQDDLLCKNDRITIEKRIQMLSHEKMVRVIVQILQSAAEKEQTVSFRFLYDSVELPKQSTSLERGKYHRALEDAANEICDFRAANFTSLMAKKDTSLPGDGFFDTYRLHRFEEYKLLVGDVATLDLSEHDKKILTNKERERVYRIART